MDELGLFGSLAEPAPEVFVVAAGEEPELLRAVFELAAELREAGISAVYDHDGKKVKAQMRAAVRAGVSHCVILGTDELARRCVGLKELATGEQDEVQRGALVQRLREAGGGGRV
jgi:histidyl-tRNA synthetase